jgi:hypothetical protein
MANSMANLHLEAELPEIVYYFESRFRAALTSMQSARASKRKWIQEAIFKELVSVFGPRPIAHDVTFFPANSLDICWSFNGSRATDECAHRNIIPFPTFP